MRFRPIYLGVVAALTCSPAAFAQIQSAPLQAGQPDQTPAQGEQPHAGPVQESKPTPASPFSPTTPPGDPFGTNMASGIPQGMLSGANGVKAGPVTIFPGVGIALRYDDNMFTTTTNKKSNVAAVVSPAVVAEMRTPGGHAFSASYIADANYNFNSHTDDFVAGRAQGTANFVVTTQARVSMRLERTDSIDPRGSTDRPSSPEPDRWHSNSFSGLASLGAEGAQGRLEFEGGAQEKRYENNRTFTQFSDRDTTFYGAGFFWRVMPKTQLLVQYRHTKIDYTDAANNIDSTEQRYLAGVTWQATAKTSGTVRAGALRKNFDAGTRQDFSGFTYAVDVAWAPLTYSTYNVTAARETNESTGVGDFILTNLVLGTWNHAWNSLFTTTARLGYREDKFEGAGTNRADEIYTAGLGFGYRFRRWLTFGGQYQYTKRSSNIGTFDYDRNQIMLNVGATM